MIRSPLCLACIDALRAKVPRCQGPKCLAFGRALLGLTSSAGAGGGTRTRTGIAPQRILSPLRLPFRHTGVRIQMEARLAR